STLLSLKRGISIPHEIIVSDGGSSDKTIEIARKYADKVVIYSGKIRQTIAGGRNAGAAAASGEYLIFLDADCEIQDINGFFQTAIDRFLGNKKLVALTCEIHVFPQRA